MNYPSRKPQPLRSRALRPKTPEPSIAAPARSGWRHDLIVGLVSGVVVATATMLGQAAVDDERSSREARLENLKFVRERSSENLSPRPFSGMDLDGQNLSGLSLAESSMDEALMRRGIFFDTVLEGADLRRAQASEAHFSAVNLADVDLSMANLSDSAIAFSDMRGSLLMHTDLKGAWLEGVNMADAKLIYPRLDGASLHDVDLAGVDLSMLCYDALTTFPDALFFNPPKMDVEQCEATWGGYR